jgi:hypothetical protein
MTENHSNVDDFILTMGDSKERIPIVYSKSEVDVVIKQQDGSISTRKNRYDNGKDVVFKCSKCGDYIAKGRKTNEKEDEIDLFCFNCRKDFYYNGAIVWSKDPLWYKKKSQNSRSEYDVLMKKYLEKNKPEIIEL